jgi:hypothetical protein
VLILVSVQNDCNKPIYNTGARHIPDEYPALDGQKLSFQCPKVKANVDNAGRYSDIFTDKIDSKLVKTLVNIMKFRDEYTSSRKLM